MDAGAYRPNEQTKGCLLYALASVCLGGMLVLSCAHRNEQEKVSPPELN